MAQPPPMCKEHPEVIAPWVCQECRQPLCDECRVKVRDKSACRSCAQAVSARTGARIQDVSSAALAATSAELPTVITPDSPSPLRLLASTVIAGVVGLVGVVIWEKIAFYTGRGWLYFFPAIGFCVGFCVIHWGKREGVVAGILAAAVYSAAMLYGHHLFVEDVLSRFARGTGLQARPLTLQESWPLIKQAFTPLHWILVAAGLITAFVSAQKLSPRSFSPAPASPRI